MSVMYESIAPVSQQDVYIENQAMEFVMSLNGKKIVPGSICLEGTCAVYKDRSAETVVGTGDVIMFDNYAGYHGVIRDITTVAQKVGTLETLQYYPRLVKERRLCTEFENSLGTETRLACEGVLAARGQTAGLAKGMGAVSNRKVKIPFSLKLQFCLNRASGPMSANAMGDVKIRLVLAADQEFLYGESCTSASGYKLRDVRLRFQTIPDDGKLQPVTLPYMHAYAVNIDSNNQNVSAFVPGICEAVHMSFIKDDNENDVEKNYIACEVPPGKPPLGSSDSSVTPKEYGIERLYYAINDVDTALVGFTLESREELMRNGIRSFSGEATRFNSLIRKLRDPAYPDGYVLGIPFGGPIQLQNNRFACEIQSQCSNADQYRAYMHFQCVQQVDA